MFATNISKRREKKWEREIDNENKIEKYRLNSNKIINSNKTTF